MTPDRTYYGIDRAVPMTVKVPADIKGEASIKLFAPQGTEPTASAPVAAVNKLASSRKVRVRFIGAIGGACRAGQLPMA